MARLPAQVAYLVGGPGPFFLRGLSPGRHALLSRSCCVCPLAVKAGRGKTKMGCPCARHVPSCPSQVKSVLPSPADPGAFPLLTGCLRVLWHKEPGPAGWQPELSGCLGGSDSSFETRTSDPAEPGVTEAGSPDPLSGSCRVVVSGVVLMPTSWVPDSHPHNAPMVMRHPSLPRPGGPVWVSRAWAYLGASCAVAWAPWPGAAACGTPCWGPEHGALGGRCLLRPRMERRQSHPWSICLILAKLITKTEKKKKGT